MIKRISLLAFILICIFNCKEENKKTNKEEKQNNKINVVQKEEISFYELSPKNSKFAWNGLGFNVNQTGTVNFKSGYLKLDGDIIKEGEFILDMSSIDVWVLKGTAKQKLEKFLNEKSFFDTIKYPEAVFTVVDCYKDGEEMVMSGDLTLKGLSLPIEPFNFTIEYGGDGKVLYFSTEKFDFNRKDWGIETNSQGTEGLIEEYIIKDFIQVKIDSRLYKKNK